MGGIDADGSLSFFPRHRGFCDCEIIYNVALTCEEDGYLKEEDADEDCIDCKVNTSAIREYNMVLDEVWDRAGGVEGMMCIGCLECRLGRKLRQIDFGDYPLNSSEEFRGSERLKSRLTAGQNLTQPSS
jgi:hypothetical protein